MAGAIRPPVLKPQSRLHSREWTSEENRRRNLPTPLLWRDINLRRPSDKGKCVNLEIAILRAARNGRDARNST